MEIVYVLILAACIGVGLYAWARFNGFLVEKLESVFEPLYELIVGGWWDRREAAKARPVFDRVHGFASTAPSDHVAAAIVQRWGRRPPTGPAGFYVFSVTPDDVVMHLGNHVNDRFCAARIRFETRNPAAGRLTFFDTAHGVGYEAAERLTADFAALLAAMAPGSTCEPMAPPTPARTSSQQSGVGLLVGSAILALAAVAFLLARSLPYSTFTYPNGDVVVSQPAAWYLVTAFLLGVALLAAAVAVALTRRPTASVGALVLSIGAVVLVVAKAAETTGSVDTDAAAGLVVAVLSAVAAVVVSIWCLVKSAVDAHRNPPRHLPSINASRP